MRRPLARFVFVVLLGTVATLLGIVTSMTLTPPGRDLLARAISEGLNRIVTGSVEIGTISGSFVYDLTLEELVVRDTQGVLLAELPRVRFRYRIPNFVAGHIVLSGIEVDTPTIQLIKHRNGRMNYEEVLGIGKGAPGGKSPLVRLDDVRINAGTLRIALPWNPPPSLRTAAQRDSALAAERARPGRLIESSPEGPRRVMVFDDLTAGMPMLQISTPDRRPFTIDLDTLATRLNDPAVTLRDATGRLYFRGDSAVFSMARIALPGTTGAGGGAVTWPQDTILFDFQFAATRVDLADLRWVSPDFPDMTGSGLLTAKSRSGAVTAYALRELHLENGPQRVDGELVAVQDRTRGIGVEDMDLRLRDLDLDVARAYVDSLPFFGRLSGTLRGRGWLLGALDLSVDWAFADARVPGDPVTTIAASGRVIVDTSSAKGASPLVFRNVQVRRSDVDLRTVRELAPAVIVPGRLTAVGTLDGPLLDVTFRGVARHRDAGRPESVLNGMVHLDTRRDTLGLDLDADVTPLSLEGIRGGFPSLAAQGDLTGHVRTSGFLDRLAVEADLAGRIGRVQASGFVTMLPPRWAAEDLLLRFSALDLAALRGSGPVTRLDGELTVAGSVDTLRAPEGELRLALRESRVREWTLDTLATRVAVADSVITVDSLYTEWLGARAGGSGTLGWARPHEGQMRFELTADSLVAFDSLALALTGWTRTDTSAALAPLNGAAVAQVTLAGSLDSLAAAGALSVRDFRFQNYRSPELRGDFVYTGGAAPRFEVHGIADTLVWGARTVRNLGVAARGRPDSLEWSGGVNLGFAAEQDSRVDVAGGWLAREGRRILRVDSLSAAVVARRWRLQDTVTIALDSAPAISPLALMAEDGSGLVRVSGRIPGSAPGDGQLEVLGLDLASIYSLLGRDTTGIAGEIGADLSFGGTSREPVFRGTARLSSARFGESRTPFAQAVVDYADRRLQANLILWRTGERLLTAETQLPLDLGFGDVERRQLPGPIMVRARADSVDLAILEALTPTITDVRGTVSVDAQVAGTWDAPRLAGFAELQGGAVSLPSLGTRFSSVRGRLQLAGDSLTFTDFQIASGRGRMDVRGLVRLENLTRPVLALDLRASNFYAIDVPNFASLEATGDVQLRGPLIGATLSGSATANRGVLYFADLLNKNVIDLSDPINADLVDTTQIRERGLGAQFQNIFLDSLHIRDFGLTVGDDFWLRSNEANIQLTGRGITVNKTADSYRIAGTFTALRGTYTLKIGPVSRDFTVEKGTVTYFDTPDLNAQLDVQARHVVRTEQVEVPVIAEITGTLQEPKLQLTSAPNVQPPLAEVDLVSYLILGVPASQAQVDQSEAFSSIASYFSSALSSELERALISDLGLPISVLEIRPGLTTSGGRSVTTLAAGWQVSRKIFFTVSAGVCGEATSFDTRNLGAGLELRFSREWRSKLSLDPTFQFCGLRALGNQYQPTADYQAGMDLLWEREF